MLKPLILDILTFPILISHYKIQQKLYRKYLRRKYWQKIVRLAEKTSPIKEDPDSDRVSI